MGFMDEIEKIAGAVVAVEATKKIDPNAGIFTEGAAAIAGYEGVKAVEEHFEEKKEESAE